MASDSVHFLRPVQTNERVPALDVLRGVALFGILIVNISNYGPEVSSTLDGVVLRFIHTFMIGSFYPMFSMLFGVGFAVFLERATAKGGHALATYLRRIAVLVVIAVLQIVLLEDRDILLRYAFMALPLLLFWKASVRQCVGAAFVCVTIVILQAPVERAIVESQIRDPVAEAKVREQRDAEQAVARERLSARRRASETHRFVDYAVFRAEWRLPARIASSVNLRRNDSLLHILAMFLLGVAGWRAGVFSRPTRYHARLKSASLWGCAAGVLGNLLVRSGPEGAAPAALVAWPTIHTAVTLVSDTVLTTGYVAIVMLLISSQSQVWGHVFAPLALVGRMGLTNYLWQSVAMSLLFLPYGFRLADELPYWTYSLIGVAIYLSHFPLSAWWMARFRFGPVEWLWRSATYGRWQPMRPATAASA